ncbi:MAG: pseudouridine synthase [Capsulimonadaceae bacterium]
MPERLQKVLAAAGIASRRACEELIQQGRVSVNGSVVTEMGAKVDLAVDRVICDGRRIKAPERHYYIALNKPRGVACTVADPHAARTVLDLVDLQSRPFLRPVGRLDVDSEGLILLTDDGDFLYKMTHPRHHVGKTYRAVVRGVPDGAALARLTHGIHLSDGMTQPATDVRLRKSTREADGSGRAEVELTIFEGRNRQVRRMFSALELPVQRLIRIRIGNVRLVDLPSGGWRHLTQGEVTSLLGEADGMGDARPRPGKTPDAQSKPPAGRGAKTAGDTQNKETNRSWQTAALDSTPPKGPSLSNSTRPRPPSQRQTSSVLRKADSTTALPSTATSRVL